MEKLYKVDITIYSLGYANIDNSYVYMDLPTVV